MPSSKEEIRERRIEALEQEVNRLGKIARAHRMLLRSLRYIIHRTHPDVYEESRHNIDNAVQTAREGFSELHGIEE